MKGDERRPCCSRRKRLDRYCDYLPRERKNAQGRHSRPEVLEGILGSQSLSASCSPSLALTINDVSEVSSSCGTLLRSTSHGIETLEDIARNPRETNGLLLLSPVQSYLLPPLSLSSACSLVLSLADHCSGRFWAKLSTTTEVR